MRNKEEVQRLRKELGRIPGLVDSPANAERQSWQRVVYGSQRPGPRVTREVVRMNQEVRTPDPVPEVATPAPVEEMGDFFA